MSILVTRVRTGFYLDSVALMRVSRAVTGLAGVESAALMIGSPSNKAILAASGLLDDAASTAVANDLVIAVRARDEAAAQAALAEAEKLLAGPASASPAGGGLIHVKRLESALARLAGVNLALVSVPGEFAAAEGRRALLAGLNVVMFSDNVPIEQEVALKRLAQERGLLMMGPDCGTCFINGAPIAFANAVTRGSIGIVSASGTGLQEVATLVARAGHGIAHGIGVGGRDLSEKVGGITTLMAIDALDADPAVERIVLISKPPARAVSERIAERIGKSGKPFTVCFLGARGLALPANATLVPTLRAAAEHCLGGTLHAPGFVEQTFAAHATRRSGRILGLYCGGTLCAEAQDILAAAGLGVESNAPVPGAKPASAGPTTANTLLDLGDDEYTRGRPHPMIEPEVRTPPLAAALRDPGVGVILLDVVLGYGAHEDPAGVVVRVLAERPRRDAIVIASVTGTDGDPQGYSRQVRALEAAGVIVAPSNAHAAELAVRFSAR
jgi:FdrA protein